MILLLDIGNSRLKWAQSDGRTLTADGVVSHDGDPASALAELSLPPVQQVWVCHVTGADHEASLDAAIKARLLVSPRFARTTLECAGLRIAYAEPRRLGVDRWLCMLALWTQLRAPFCIAGAGTALTFDAVDASGLHLGGVIAPGLSSTQSAVLGATRFEVRNADQRYDDSLGDDTESCVRQGALHACAGLIDRLSARYPGVHVITGGDAETLWPHLADNWELRPQLVLEGLLAWSRSGS